MVPVHKVHKLLFFASQVSMWWLCQLTASKTGQHWFNHYQNCSVPFYFCNLIHLYRWCYNCHLHLKTTQTTYYILLFNWILWLHCLYHCWLHQLQLFLHTILKFKTMCYSYVMCWWHHAGYLSEMFVPWKSTWKILKYISAACDRFDYISNIAKDTAIIISCRLVITFHFVPLSSYTKSFSTSFPLLATCGHFLCMNNSFYNLILL